MQSQNMPGGGGYLAYVVIRGDVPLFWVIFLGLFPDFWVPFLGYSRIFGIIFGYSRIFGYHF